MNNVETLYLQSSLALAAYGTFLSSGEISVRDLSDPNVGMASDQAKTFASEWETAAPTFTGALGLSATVFRNKIDGSLHLAIRGTQDLLDYGANAILALGISNKLNAQWLSLDKKLTTDWLKPGGLLNGVMPTVSGHSLGGYLAAAVKQKYFGQFSGTYLYNAPGTGGILGTLGGLLSNLFAQAAPGDYDIWNVKASEGLSIIAGLGGQLSGSLPIDRYSNYRRCFN